MSKPQLKLYFDIISPFGYLAYYLLRHSPVFKPCEVTYVPILLGGLMKTVGNRPPLEVPNKYTWINIERQRWATLYNIPMPVEAPDNFPVSTLAIQRALVAVNSIAPDKLTAAVDACYKKFWAERNVENVHKPEVLANLLSSAIGEDLTKKVLERANTPEGKAELNKNTEASVGEVAFGVPWFVATNKEGKTESFWGFDHIGQVTHFLGLETPRAKDGWQAML